MDTNSHVIVWSVTFNAYTQSQSTILWLWCIAANNFSFTQYLRPRTAVPVKFYKSSWQSHDYIGNINITVENLCEDVNVLKNPHRLTLSVFHTAHEVNKWCSCSCMYPCPLGKRFNDEIFALSLDWLQQTSHDCQYYHARTPWQARKLKRASLYVPISSAPKQMKCVIYGTSPLIYSTKPETF